VKHASGDIALTTLEALFPSEGKQI